MRCVAAVVVLCGFLIAQAAPRTALVYEDSAFIAEVEAALQSEWRLVPVAPDLPKDILEAVEATFGPVPAEILPALPSLKLVQAVGHVSPLEDRAHTGVPEGAKVCRGDNALGSQYQRTIAEWCLAATFEMVFRIGRVDAQMRSCAWSEDSPACPMQSGFGTRPSLMNMTLGIVGYGSIGKSIAALAAPIFGAVVGSTPSASGPPPSPLTWWSASNDDVLQSSDVVVLAFPNNIPALAGLMNETAFGIMKEGAYLVMFVGGAGVDEQAAYDAAKSGHLAGLAVNEWWERYAWRGPRGYTSPEGDDWWAPPSRVPFNDLENVIMSPNACMKSETYWRNEISDVARNLDLVAAGQEPCPESMVASAAGFEV